MSIVNGTLNVSAAGNTITYASKNGTTNKTNTEAATTFLTNINSFVNSTASVGGVSDISIDIKQLVDTALTRDTNIAGTDVNMTSISDVTIYLSNDNAKMFGTTGDTTGK